MLAFATTFLLFTALAGAQSGPLPPWNNGPVNQAMVEFIQKTTDKSGPRSYPRRIATFDQDGALWVEHPIYTQVLYCLHRVPAVAAESPNPG